MYLVKLGIDLIEYNFVVRVPTLVGNLRNSWEFDLGHWTQAGYVGNLLNLCKVVGSSQKDVSIGKITSQILENNGKIGNFASDRLWEPCRFDWEMIRDEDLKSWELVGNLLIFEEWETCVVKDGIFYHHMPIWVCELRTTCINSFYLWIEFNPTTDSRIFYYNVSMAEIAELPLQINR